MMINQPFASVTFSSITYFLQTSKLLHIFTPFLLSLAYAWVCGRGVSDRHHRSSSTSVPTLSSSSNRMLSVMISNARHDKNHEEEDAFVENGTFLTSVKGNREEKGKGLRYERFRAEKEARRHVFSEKQVHPDDERLFGDLQERIAAVTDREQSSELIRKRRDLDAIDAKLNELEKASGEREVAMRKREKEFRQKKRAMKDRMEKLQQFILENDHKRERAEVKERAEMKTRRSYEDTIRQRREELARYKIEKESMRRRLHRHMTKYQEFLELVVERTPDMYSEVWEVLNRHKTLVETKKDLESNVSDTNRRVESARTLLSQLRTEGQKVVLLRRGQVHSYQKRLEELTASRMTQSMQIERDMMVHKEKSREFAQVIMAMRNLYARCVSTKRRNKRSHQASSSAASPTMPNSSTVARRTTVDGVNASRANEATSPTGHKTSSPKTASTRKKTSTAMGAFDRQDLSVREKAEMALQYISSRIIVLQDIRKGYDAFERAQRESGT